MSDTARSRRDGDPIPLQVRSGRNSGYSRQEQSPFLVPARPPAPRKSPTPWQRFRDRNCRALNVLVALLGIVLTLPLMVLIALAVKLTSKGPVLYSQKRVGLDKRSYMDRRRNGRAGAHGRRKGDLGGRIFTIYKFRTMFWDATTGKQVWTTEGDRRITPVGKVLRRYRLDEFPQFFNVLKGDMNVVGPRPEQPAIFRDLNEEIEGYRDRQRVLPGITGWAQVNHHYDKSVRDVRNKVALDLEYIRRRSVSEDLKIMLRTVSVMIGKKGSL